MFECYNNVIGITAQDCACQSPDTRPEDYDESLSGLFLDELTSISGMLTAGECDKDMWALLAEAIKNGTDQFIKDTNLMLTRSFDRKRKDLKSQIIGQVKARSYYTAQKNYAVVRYACAPIRGGYAKLKSLTLAFENIGTFDVSIYDNVTGLIDTVSVTTQANGAIDVTEKEIMLPLFSKYVDVLEYYFVYAFDANNRPKNTEVSCGCGGNKLSYSLDDPYFHQVGRFRAAPWTNYIMAGGSEIDSLDELDDLSLYGSNKTFGLAAEFDFGCKVDEVLCNTALDFERNPLAMSLAFAIRYAAAAYVAGKMVRSDSVDFEGLVNAEQWEEDEEVWTQKYLDHVSYIVESADISANDCLKCKDVIELTRNGIFS